MEVKAEQTERQVLCTVCMYVYIVHDCTVYTSLYLYDSFSILVRVTFALLGKILRAYAYLKSHGIEVKLDLQKLPKSLPLGKWESKGAKILADQLIFSSLYTLVFFIGVGMLTGAADMMELRSDSLCAVCMYVCIYVCAQRS